MSDWIFRFEFDDDPDGRWIPLAVRMRLDLSGRKISLADWQALTPAARRELVATPVGSPTEIDAFARLLEHALAVAGHGNARELEADKLAGVSVWRDPGAAPAEVAAELAALDSSTLWPRLDLFGRYVVDTLVRKGKRRELAGAITELKAHGRVKP